MRGTERFFLELERSLHLRFRLGETSRPHIDVREKVKGLRYPGVSAAGCVLADCKRASVIFFRLRVATLSEVGVAEVFQSVAHYGLIAASIILDNAQRAFLQRFRLGIAALMFVNASESVQRFRQISDRRGTWCGILKNRQCEFIKILRLGVLAEHIERPGLEKQSAGIAFVLGAVTCSGGGFEPARFV